jgi:hypothetical protein
VKMLTAFHLAVVQRAFLSREYNENYIENVDETHFVINMDNGKALRFCGNQAVKCATMVFVGETMTMVVCITGGVRATIMTPMIIFTNQMRNYPIRGIQHNVLGVCYRTKPKGWMDIKLFLQYFAEPQAYQGDPHQHLKHVWCDNLSSHNLSPKLD